MGRGDANMFTLDDGEDDEHVSLNPERRPPEALGVEGGDPYDGRPRSPAARGGGGMAGEVGEGGRGGAQAGPAFPRTGTFAAAPSAHRGLPASTATAYARVLAGLAKDALQVAGQTLLEAGKVAAAAGVEAGREAADGVAEAGRRAQLGWQEGMRTDGGIRAAIPRAGLALIGLGPSGGRGGGGGGYGARPGGGHSHRFTEAQKRKLGAVESIEYLAPSSEAYRRHLRRTLFPGSSGEYPSTPSSAAFSKAAVKSARRQFWERWLMMAAVGATVGSTGFLLHICIHSLASAKYHGTRWLLSHVSVSLGWIYNLLLSVGMVLVSSWLVVHVAPEAGGAGVPEVTAYLNGCSLPRILNLRTYGVKFVSAALAVGSGLPVGPEGPMVHMGAAVGACLTQGHSTLLGCDTGWLRDLQNPTDKRDFVTAGAAVGVAAAFSAPVGGLLFVFEEVASFWKRSLGWQIFFANMVAVLTADTLRSAESAFKEGTFGVFDGESSTVFFEVYTVLNNHVAAMLPAALLGLICGALGILFTWINIKVVKLRNETIARDPKGRARIIEPCVLIALFVTLSMALPLFFPCTPTNCVAVQGDPTPICPAGQPEYISRVVEEAVELYTCKVGAGSSEMPAGKSASWRPAEEGPSSTNVTVPRSYNELATLMSVTGEDAIRHLFSRGTHKEFGYASLIVMLSFYFLGAAWTAGSAIASGIFVPMLLIGACVGRLAGVAVVDLAAAHGLGSEGAPPGVFLPPSPWAWIDPGAFALIGAGAFMAGVTRMTLAMAVIVMEVSNDVRMLLPVMVAVMLAKGVADLGIEPLYHEMLAIKCVPFLPPDAADAPQLELAQVRHVAQYPVLTLREKVTLGDLRAVLRSTKHAGYPVVRMPPQAASRDGRDANGEGGMPEDMAPGTHAHHLPSGEGVYVGTVLREHLLQLLVAAKARGTTRGLEVPYEDLQRTLADDAGGKMEESAEQSAALARHEILEGEEEEEEMERLRNARALSVDPEDDVFGVTGLGAGAARDPGLGDGRGSDRPQRAEGGEGRGGPRAGGALSSPPRDPHSSPDLLWSETVDLTPYLNSSAFAVPLTFSLARSYRLFSTFGLRHLVVTDERNRVRGIVTRQDLLGERLDDAVAQAMSERGGGV